MIKNNLLYLGFGFTALLGGCSTFNPQESSDEQNKTPFVELSNLIDLQYMPGNREQVLVVEDLVSAAGNVGSRNMDRTPYRLEPDDTETLIQPVTPTVTMTANRVVERAINDYLQNRRAVLRLWVERGRIYFPMIEKIFEEEGVPDELKYIALGESNLLPLAKSYAGAAGMWQFMPATGRGAGLEINEWVDERLDPEKSTRAAARHLKELYISYSENWHLALAGYNCSYRCISRAVARAGGSIENPPSFWEIYPYLPQETRQFVPKFIAGALIVSNPGMYGIEVEDIGQEYSYDVVLINGRLSLESAAELAGVDLATIKSLNPSLLRGGLPDSEEPYPLKIPLGTYTRFAAAFDRLPPQEMTAPSEYLIQRGDNLGKIAMQFDTTVAELQAVNNLRNHIIIAGQRLLIPGGGVSGDISIASTNRQFVHYGDPMYRPIELGEGFQLVEQAGSTVDEPLMAVSLSDDIIDNMMVPTVYEVRSGDTLGGIAERFGLSVREIQQWNNISGSMIYIDQELTLHTAATGASPRIYRVQRGDNLAAIARRFGVSVDNLKRWNDLNSDLIFPGQDLQLN